jgi:endoglucanase
VADHRNGLRLVRRTSDRTILLVFGESFARKPGSSAGSYRVFGEADLAFAVGVHPSSVEVMTEPDVEPPPGWAGKIHMRSRVTLRLDRPLAAGRRHWVQVLGKDHQPVTGGQAAAWVQEMDDAAERAAVADNRLGLRRLEVITPALLEATVGDSLDVDRLDADPSLVVVSSSDDPAYQAGRSAVRVGRRSRGECFVPEGWPYGGLRKHELFLAVDPPLAAGRTYRVDLAARVPLTTGASAGSVTLDDRVNLDPAISVNQVGFLPGAVRKYAYFGSWMGSSGALDGARWLSRFEVRDAASHRVVLSGAPSLRHRAGDGETKSKADLSGANVWEMDLSALTQPGTFYVAVPGSGRSLPFRVGRDVYEGPFAVMMTGVLHQRCGMEMKAPWSDFPRAACHTTGTLPTDLPPCDQNRAWAQLPEHVIGAPMSLVGGHHDAGDYKPRSHLEVAELAFLAFELNPRAFRDGQLRLPESGNGVPDILDEGRWALELWMQLQGEDGGVRGGTESNGDPDQISPPDLDPTPEYAFAPDVAATLRFAGCAAQAGLLWRGLGRPDDAARFTAAAERAWRWAFAHGAEGRPDEAALAAVQLYRLTGRDQYHAAFLKASVFASNPKAELTVYRQYDQRASSFYYAISANPVDAEVKRRIVEAWRRQGADWAAWAETTAYRWCKHPNAPNVWGSGAHPMWMVDMIQAYVLTGDGAFLDWVRLTCDWALGGNPMGTVFTARLGQRSISAPLHIVSRTSPGGPIPGLQCQGPTPETGGRTRTSSMSSWVGALLFPSGPWPDLQTYSDLGMVPTMNEGTVVDQMRSAVVYSFLLPTPPADAASPRRR